MAQAHAPRLVAVTEDAAADQHRTARAGGRERSHLRNPVTFEEFPRLARTIGYYWLGLVRLPGAADMVTDDGIEAAEGDVRA